VKATIITLLKDPQALGVDVSVCTCMSFLHPSLIHLALDPSGERGRAAGREQSDEYMQGRDTGLGRQGGDTSGHGQTGEHHGMAEKLKGL
jgi:hypothetical protein